MTATIIVGGGIAGLALAHRLVRLDPDHDVKVVEASPRPGGVVRTQRAEGFVTEVGPETIVDDGSGLSGLIGDLGLTGNTIEPRPDVKRRFIVRHGHLVEVPTLPGAFLRSPLLPLSAKARLALEPLCRRGRDPEETLASFVTRRFGREVLEQLVDPFASGIFAGLPERMEMASCFPEVWKAEQDYGSVLRGMRRARKGRGRPRIIGFRGGNEDLVNALRRVLGDRLWLGRSVTGLHRAGAQWGVTVGGEVPIELTADRIVLGIPSYRAAELVRPHDAELARELDSIVFVSLASVFLAVPEPRVPDDVRGFGFLVPRREAKNSVLGVLYSSDLFEGRARAGYKLFRAMLGGARNPSALEATDDQLLIEVRETLHDLAGVEAEPMFCRVHRYERTLPQFEPGHQARMGRVRERLAGLPGLCLTGQSYEGSGVSTCIRNARALAEELGGAT
ncbi:MAG: protoporphyrinogen oxidase [Planctomycetes bacterium]|nr:protoporphyrinogen oxidase [Planctomycetota bacterium]